MVNRPELQALALLLCQLALVLLLLLLVVRVFVFFLFLQDDLLKRGDRSGDAFTLLFLNALVEEVDS